MKKLILTEDQIKKVIDSIVNEQSQQPTVTPFTVDFGNGFESGQYKMDPNYEQIVNDKVQQILDYIKGKNLKDFKLVITPGESQVTNQPPFQEKGSLATARATELKSYLTPIFQKSFSIPVIIEIAKPIIGQTPWDPKTGKKDDPKYKTEQFVKATIVLTTQTNPEPTPTPTPIPNPNKGYIINVRGDEGDGLGAYYFPQTYDAWKKITYEPKMMGFYSNAEQYENGRRAQTTVNMNDVVFRKYWLSKAPEIEPLLGVPYLRDRNNANLFTPKK